ncbi:PIN domain-containing protein [Methanoplanus endosymbiosus]|uniref:PIN domain-containing protein n=1 Tax=Methanoplanus endosymbiosus TaxID=33865 RepID=A0A9E7TJN8_9EURY|nr:PIN domain-containing protein [Methanoplanus endosymbiosus]UUX91920.1 PIN domain-containing protein [Methanoplanus endosymbiosus]
MPLADTCFILDLLEGNVKAICILEELKKKEIEISSTIFTNIELYQGIGNKSGNPKADYDKINNILKRFPIERYCPSDSEMCGIYCRDLKCRKKNPVRKLRGYDIAIAAIAHRTGQAVITRDNHFTNRYNVPVISY